ncbi:M14 family metallopeptidase [Lederbergia lenta]|uniref:Gamma-D-glutamyl-L-diamino acid endopeptidase I n=1 Tax=Lederbergia lenta TaxID=1467 RepID=A0A2X4WG16_LEDLE|nr:M14 family metallopeptidase [Lederbergia lenta]MCM3111811.1 M14 family metallopeptidase [Lederbergia lenta]MEC2322965.1 M14 family metallopeptidase [Lederbergia lenta]SQI62121.1 gamma-D-glutamyl-L-diamino acid endopeptidase I [Lederbergia lenta]
MDVRVRAGDTLWHYSKLLYIPLVLLIDSNPEIDPNALPLGKFVKIPGFTTSKYTVRNGDTYWKLARARNVDIDALMLLNQDANPTHLKIGTILRLPERVTKPIVNGNRAYDFNIMSKDLETLRTIYPFIKSNEVGKSVLQLPLDQVRVGKSSRKVNINASFHANEWITTPILMKFLNEYLLALTNGQTIKGISALTLYLRSQLSAVPMVNPDGVNLVLNGPPASVKAEVVKLNKGNTDFSGWKANIRGVDLNKQFPANWEFEKERKPKEPGPRDFPGYSPLSEPESKAMAALAEQTGFERLLALHTQGKEIYWGYEGLEPPESEILANDFAMVSGYKSVRYVDSYAGYKDWFIQQFRKPGFTLELGLGQNPLPIEQFDEIYEHVSGIFVRALV